MIKKILILREHEGFKKYFKNTSWLFTEKLLRIFSEVFVGIWVARYLGPDKFGLLNYAISFSVLFGAIAALGLDGIVIREIVKRPDKANKILGSAFSLKLIGTLISFFMLYIAVQFTSNDKYTNYMIFIIAASLVFKSFNVIDMYFQSKVLSKYVVFANSFALMISSCTRILLILLKAPLIYFAYVFILDALIMALGYLYFYFVKGESVKKWKFDLFLAKYLFFNSWPLMLSSVVATIYMKIDQIMIKEMLSSEAVGQYAAAVRLSESWYFIPVVITASVYPAILNAKKINETMYYDRMQKLYNLMTAIGLAVAAATTFTSDLLVDLLYGANYSSAASVLTIHIWAGIFVGLGVASGKWILSENLQIIGMIRAVSGAVLNIILNYYFIKIWSIKGAAISTLISYFYVNSLSLILFKKTRICFLQQLKSVYYILKLPYNFIHKK